MATTYRTDRTAKEMYRIAAQHGYTLGEELLEYPRYNTAWAVYLHGERITQQWYQVERACEALEELTGSLEPLDARR